MTNMNRTIAKPLNIDVTKNGGVTVVAPEGPRLDAEVAGDLRAMLLQLIDSGDRQLILDLPSVTFIDSSGLGALVSALKRLKQVDPAGDIKLAHVQPSVMAVL